MFIYSIRMQSIKLYTAIFLSVISVICVILFVPFNIDSANTQAIQTSKDLEKNFKNINTMQDQISFLKQFGWDVEEEAKNIEQVTIPIKFDPVFEKYNEMQIKEGLDLKKYKGKTVKKYTFLVNNHDYDGVVYANLLIYKDRVIGGDISSAISGGFTHGLSKENLYLS